MAHSVLRWGNPPAGVQNSPVYLGLSPGAPGGAGISIQVTDTASGADHTRALLDGTFDIGHIGAPPLFAALGLTRDYALVGTGLLRHPPHSLVVAPGVEDVRMLRGKTVAINRKGTCSQSMLLTLLARARMGITDVELAEMGDGPSIVDAVRHGRIAAAMLWEPYASWMAREMGWAILVEGRSIWTPSRYCTLIYARRSLAERTPALVAGVLGSFAAWVRGAQANPPAAATTLFERMPEVPAGDLLRAVVREAPFWSSDTSLDRSLLERLMGELEVQAVLADGFDLDDAIVRV